jgi:hypothetical protein
VQDTKPNGDSGSAPPALPGPGQVPGLPSDPSPSAPADGCLPRIAVYEGENQLPRLYVLPTWRLPEAIDSLTERIETSVRHQGGRIPAEAVREIVANLVHAGLADVVITVADSGNTVRVADRGPGIPDKDRALRTGFTTAGAEDRRYIRGVGAGLSLTRAWLQQLGGDLQIEDNLLGGTVVSLSVPPAVPTADLPEPPAAIPLTERQLQILLLVVELGPIGPTRLAKELSISPSTAYRELLALDGAGLTMADKAGRRTVTESGLLYLEQVL